MDHLGIRGAFIAGGAILSKATKAEIQDYDVYPKTKEDTYDIILSFMEENKTYFVVNITDRAVTLKSNEILLNGKRPIIQVMTYAEFPTAEKIFENFDFTICMGAYDCDSKEYIYHKDFYPDIASRTLRFNPGTLYPLNSLLRVGKYRERGYFMSKPELIKLALTIGAAKQPSSWEDLESQIGGSYGREIVLQSEDVEYSLEAAIDLLSNMVLDFESYETSNADKYSELTVDTMELLFQDTVHYVDLPLKNYFRSDLFTTKYFVNDSGFIQHEVPSSLEHVIRHKMKPYEGEKLRGYKVLKKTDDPKIFQSGVYKKPLTYELGVETSCETDPWLFVFRKKPDRDGLKFEVSFELKDVKNITGNEIQVTKLTLEKQLTGE